MKESKESKIKEKKENIAKKMKTKWSGKKEKEEMSFIGK